MNDITDHNTKTLSISKDSVLFEEDNENILTGSYTEHNDKISIYAILRYYNLCKGHLSTRVLICRVLKLRTGEIQNYIHFR